MKRLLPSLEKRGLKASSALFTEQLKVALWQNGVSLTFSTFFF